MGVDLSRIDPELVEVIVSRLCQVAIDAGMQICGKRILSMSIGQAFYPADGFDAEKLLAEADRKMYQAKNLHHLGRRTALALDSLPMETAAIQ